MTRRSHRNDRRRLTARERAGLLVAGHWSLSTFHREQRRIADAFKWYPKLTESIQRALAAHARAALSRERARRGRGSR